MAGALAAASAAMAANFTAGKKKFADVQTDIERILEVLSTQQQRLLELADADAEAYSKVGTAYGMPRDTDEQKHGLWDAQGYRRAEAGPPAGHPGGIDGRCGSTDGGC